MSDFVLTQRIFLRHNWIIWIIIDRTLIVSDIYIDFADFECIDLSTETMDELYVDIAM